MAVPGAGFVINATAVGLTAATAKTVIGVASGANNPISIVEIGCSGDGASGFVLIELVFGTNASNPPGTASTTFTPLQIRGSTQTMNGTAAVNWSTEPTVLVVVKRWRMPWPGGPFIVQFPLGREPTSIPTAATSGKFVGIRANSTTTITNTDWYLEVEE